jgi:hypothetical protein
MATFAVMFVLFWKVRRFADSGRYPFQSHLLNRFRVLEE